MQKIFINHGNKQIKQIMKTELPIKIQEKNIYILKKNGKILKITMMK